MTTEERNKLVVEYLPLVRSHADRLAKQYHQPVEELESHGVIGLIQAVETWVPDHRRPDTWFAARIIGAILDGMRSWSKVKRYRLSKAKKDGVFILPDMSMNTDRPRYNGTWAEAYADNSDDPKESVDRRSTLDYLMEGLGEREKQIVHLYLKGFTSKGLFPDGLRISKEVRSVFGKKKNIGPNQVSNLWNRVILPHMRARAEKLVA